MQGDGGGMGRACDERGEAEATARTTVGRKIVLRGQCWQLKLCPHSGQAPISTSAWSGQIMAQPAAQSRRT